MVILFLSLYLNAKACVNVAIFMCVCSLSENLEEWKRHPYNIYTYPWSR